MHAVKLKIDEPIISLESQMAHLSIESELVSNVIEYFKNIIPSLSGKIKELLESLESTDVNKDAVLLIMTSNKSLLKKIPYADYSNYSKLLVSVPEGFKGDILEYTKMLNQLNPKVFKEANNLLTEYSFILSAFITNKDSKITLNDHTHLYNKIKKNREDLTRHMVHYFSTGNSSKTYLGQVLGRLKDLDDLAKSTIALNREDNVNSNLDEIVKSTNNILSLLDIVTDGIQKGSINNVSGAAAKNISEGAYELAKLIEFVSLYSFRVDQVININSKIMDQLDKAIA